MNKLTFEEYLDTYNTLTYKNVGISMRPMIKQGRDLMVIAKRPAGRLKKMDVVLYKRPPERYILHRIVEVRENDYVILGDNCISKEYGIKDEDIIGILTEFVHRGKTISVDNKWYKLYSNVWYKLYPIRKIFKTFLARVKNVLRPYVKRKKETGNKNEV